MTPLLTWGRRRPRLLVAVPAHDEQGSIAAALAHVRAALVVATAAGAVSGADVVVSAHRCTDATAEVARRALAGLPTGRGIVVEDLTSTTVGEVRDRAVRTALATGDRSHRPAGTWLLSTDADSRVPLDWVASLLGPAAHEGAIAVAGMVSLVDWDASPRARATYEQILAAGMIDARHHRHVYAANLAVRLDAYLAVGGFARLPHGEEQGLVDSLRAAGHPVTSSRASVVRTSGRMPGRAAAGLGALLGRLDGPTTTVAPPADAPDPGLPPAPVLEEIR